MWISYLYFSLIYRYEVAVKRMDLKRQQRRELLFNEVVIMRDYKHENIVQMYEVILFHSFIYIIIYFNNRFLRERGMASNPKMEYQVFLGIFQKNSAMATLGLKEMGKFLWEGREKGLSQFSFAKLRQPTGQTFFPTFPKEFSHFLQT